MTIRSLRAMPACVLAGVVVACSNNESAAPTVAAAPAESATVAVLPDPCTLLTERDIEGIVPKDVKAHEKSLSAGSPHCTWYDTTDFSVVTVQVFENDELYAVSRGLATARPIGGLGDEAHLGAYGLVYVKKGGRSFFAQSLVPLTAADVTPELRAAATGIEGEPLATYAASLRFAQRVADRF